MLAAAFPTYPFTNAALADAQAVVVALAPRLTSLHLGLGTPHPFDSAAWCSGGLPALRRLTVAMDDGREGTRPGPATLSAHMGRLPSLEVGIGCGVGGGGWALLRTSRQRHGPCLHSNASPLAPLPPQALTIFGCGGVQLEAGCLPPSLTHLRLVSASPLPATLLAAATAAAAGSLRQLSLFPTPADFDWAPLAQLAALSYLALQLRPSAASPLPRKAASLPSLRRLRLGGALRPDQDPDQALAPVLGTLTGLTALEFNLNCARLPRCLGRLPHLRALEACAAAATAAAAVLAAATRLTSLCFHSSTDSQRRSGRPKEGQVLALLRALRELPALQRLRDDGGLARAASVSPRCVQEYGLLLRALPAVECRLASIAH